MTLPRPERDLATRRARALADATRHRLLELLHSEPADVRSLAARTGLHENAVRQHMAVLGDAGLVVHDVERVGGRVGRPRTLYRTVPGCPFAAIAGPVVCGVDRGAISRFDVNDLAPTPGGVR